MLCICREDQSHVLMITSVWYGITSCLSKQVHSVLNLPFLSLTDITIQYRVFLPHLEITYGKHSENKIVYNAANIKY